jgi:hypothetical protein
VGFNELGDFPDLVRRVHASSTKFHYYAHSYSDHD